MNTQWFERARVQKALQGIREAILRPDAPVARVEVRGFGPCYQMPDGVWILLLENAGKGYRFAPESQMARIARKALAKQGCDDPWCGNVPTPEDLRIIRDALDRQQPEEMPHLLRAYACEPTCCQRAEDVHRDECLKCGKKVILRGDGGRAG